MFTLSELLGVILLLPILHYVIDRRFPTSVIDAIGNFGFFQPSDEALFVYILGAYIVRFFLTRLIVHLQLREVYKILGLLNSRLFRKLLLSGRAQKMEDVMQCGMIEANNVCIGFYMQFIRLISEMFFVLLTLFSLFFLLPKLSLILFISFGLSVLILQKINKSRLSRYGKERVAIDGERTGFFEFAARGSLEVKAYNVTDRTLIKFEALIQKFASLGWKQQNIKMMQKYWIETIFVVSAVIALGFALFASGGQLDSVGTAVLFGSVAVKTVPAISRITNHNNSLHYFQSSIQKYIDFVDGL